MRWTDMSEKFILDKSNAREKTIEIVDKHSEYIEGYDVELVDYVRSEDILDEIMNSIEEGLDNLSSRVSFNLSYGEFGVDVDVTVYEIEQDSLYARGVLSPEFSRLVKLYIFAEDYSVDEDYVICDDVYYRIDMLRED
jgi:hypothetical protein